MRLLIIDDDVDFRKRFSAFLASGCGDISITVCGEGNVQTAELQGADHILFDEGTSKEIVERIVSSGKECTQLSSEEYAVSTGSTHFGKVYKYQSAPEIIKGISELSELLSYPGIASGSRERMKVFCVTGFSGGCGRTTFSLVLSRMLRQKTGEAVLLICTGQLSDMYDYFPEITGSRGPDINLLLLNYASGSMVNPGAYMINDSFGVSAIRMPASQLSDLSALSGDEISGFIEHVRKWGMFGSVVIDMDAEINERNTVLYDLADVICLIHDDRRHPDGMESRWEKTVFSERNREGILRILNYDMTGAGYNRLFFNEISGESGTLYDLLLPADPDSFYISEGRSDINMAGAYAAAVESFFERLRKVWN